MSFRDPIGDSVRQEGGVLDVRLALSDGPDGRRGVGVGRRDQDVGRGDAGRLSGLGLGRVHQFAGDQAVVHDHEGDLRLAVVEDKAAGVERVMGRGRLTVRERTVDGHRVFDRGHIAGERPGLQFTGERKPARAAGGPRQAEVESCITAEEKGRAPELYSVPPVRRRKLNDGEPGRPLHRGWNDDSATSGRRSRRQPRGRGRQLAALARADRRWRRGSHADPPVEWTASGKNVRWKAALPGRGSATPIVWGDRIFILTALWTERVAKPEELPKVDPDCERMTDPPQHYYKFVVLCLD